MAEDLLEKVIPYVNRLWMVGCGEVFYSPIYRKMIIDKRCTGRGNISILSNGTLFNERNWSILSDCYSSLEIVISLDGYKDETIERLRRGANAKTLKTNLVFLGERRKENKVKKLFVNCVLQAENVAELYDLLEYCRQIGVDKVQFIRLKNNGIYEDESSYDRASIFDENGVKEGYRSYFTEKLLNHPLADWFNNAALLHVKRKPRLDKYDTM